MCSFFAYHGLTGILLVIFQYSSFYFSPSSICRAFPSDCLRFDYLGHVRLVTTTGFPGSADGQLTVSWSPTIDDSTSLVVPMQIRGPGYQASTCTSTCWSTPVSSNRSSWQHTSCVRLHITAMDISPTCEAERAIQRDRGSDCWWSTLVLLRLQQYPYLHGDTDGEWSL